MESDTKELPLTCMLYLFLISECKSCMILFHDYFDIHLWKESVSWSGYFRYGLKENQMLVNFLLLLSH